MALIKSHSNYVLKSKHQVIEDGTIWERDITTIGGISDFPSGQIPVYKSGNFIISVRGDGGVGNKYTTSRWKSNDSGDVWTVSNITALTSEDETQDDTKIVLKQDYYDYRDFAYYGSLTELMRASIGDILTRFPGEIYQTENPLTYTKIEDGVPTEAYLGGQALCELDNPFGINLYAQSLPENADLLKYFAEGGYKNYQIFETQYNQWHDIADGGWVAEYNSDSTFCPGERIWTITITPKGWSNGFAISAYVNDDMDIVYGRYSGSTKVILRPKQEFIDAFYNGCDNFQRLLANPNTSPKYKATFSVIKENDFGYYRELEDFVFPTSEGGYNLDATAFGFNTYTSRLAEIGAYYDEKFSDNLYRALTHESIKNFDWSRSRGDDGEIDEDILLGAERMKKTLRLVAREFDEVKSYIDGIRNVNSVTYDERNNIPDYFLADTLSDDGWDVKQVYPYSLSETRNGTDYTSYTSHIDQTASGIVRNFYQNTKETVTPYAPINSAQTDGYFVVCNCQTGVADKVNASGKATTWDDCSDTIRFRMAAYSSDKEYTVYDAGNQFLRNLKINSRNIWRKKGTVEGIESMLGMFGLKSSRFDSEHPDYTITEYTMRVDRIEDPYSGSVGMYKYDWYNSTKAIQYDYRSESDINQIGPNYYLPYQGLPVAYRYPYSNESGDSGDVRFLYPNFSKYEKYDGDPYFQMDGGWFSKVVQVGKDNDSPKKYNFSFTVDNDVLFIDEVTASTATGYNCPLFTETVNTVRSVTDVDGLLAIPSNELFDGQVCYVDSVPDNLLVIDESTYPIETEYSSGGVGYHYVEFEVMDGLVIVGNESYTDNITVYSKAGVDESSTECSALTTTYHVADKYDGYKIKAYLKPSGDTYDFICKDTCEGYYTIGEWFIIPTGETYTNYFVINHTDYSYAMSEDGIYGWKRLQLDDCEYKKMMTAIAYYKGNNPHSGLMQYDNGHEYLTYFSRLFKYAYDNDKFDERCFTDVYSEVDEINAFGFSGLVDDDERVKWYDDKLIEDNKVHYFGNYRDSGGTIYAHTCDSAKTSGLQTFYTGSTVTSYTLNRPEGMMLGDSDYTEIYTSKTGIQDDVTNQVLNTKRMEIDFFLHKPWYEQEGQCELKYIDDIVMNYLTQVVPSTAIVKVVYKER